MAIDDAFSTEGAVLDHAIRANAHAFAQFHVPFEDATHINEHVVSTGEFAAHIDSRRVCQGNALGQFNLAMMHLRKELPDARDATAWRLLRKAADQQLALAENALGEMIEQGRHGAPDAAAACDWFGRAAAHGSGDGALSYGTCFYLGRGRPQDMAQAQHWYLEAAKAGDVGAQYLVASMFETGLGVEPDRRLARYWYEAAARNGDVAARAKVLAMDREL